MTASWSLTVIVMTNDLSIFSSVTGRLRRCASDE